MSSSSSSVLTDSVQDLTTPYNNLQNKDELDTTRNKREADELSPGELTRTTFELFRTYDGEEYTVYMRDDGKRFYVDFDEQVDKIIVHPFHWGMHYLSALFSCSVGDLNS